MSQARREPAHVLRGGLRQPDRRSCGASVLVAARMLADPAYASSLAPEPAAAFARETLDLHRRVTRARDAAGRLQPPWPRAIGTPPWAVARHLAALTEVAYTTRLVRLGMGAEPDRVRRALARRHPVALYVGDRWLPRHVVLVVGGDEQHWQVYEPASGQVLDVPLARVRAGAAALAGWDRPWFVVAPA